MDLKIYRDAVERHREEILAVEQHIWNHPETGYKEWNTSRYLEAVFENAGYTLVRAGNIPGFYTDIETGRSGPKILIMAELDALVAPNHFHAVDGCAHACGHNAQCAALVGAALAFKEPGILNELSGSIRLMAVPAEEMIETEFREELRSKGIIHFLSGKAEFIYRGFMNDVDLAYMFHTALRTDYKVYCTNGYNGMVVKEALYEGIAAHASTAPHLAVNALYAASLGLQAINSLRETFTEDDLVRVHPIMEEGGEIVNIIPSRAKLNMCVRASNMNAIWETDKKVNRALASGALAVGAKVRVTNRCSYTPMNHSAELKQVAEACMVSLYGRENVCFNVPRISGSTDAGEVSALIPTMHGNVGGAAGKSHGDDFYIQNPELACVQSAVAQVALAAVLLKSGAEKARGIINAYEPQYASREEYVRAMDNLICTKELIDYEKDHCAKIMY